MKQCSSCGVANSDHSKFCAQCGARLVQPTGDTTHVIPIVDDDAARVDLDVEEATAKLSPGTALLIVTRGMGADARYVLDRPEMVAGRAPECDMLLDDITVSRRHATFSLQGGTVVLTDHGSLNGTYVNRDLISAPTALKRGDEIQIGKFKMVLLAQERGSD